MIQFITRKFTDLEENNALMKITNKINTRSAFDFHANIGAENDKYVTVIKWESGEFCSFHSILQQKFWSIKHNKVRRTHDLGKRWRSFEIGSSGKAYWYSIEFKCIKG